MNALYVACQAWQLSGDAYATHPGDKPWISEMYGYSFGAAKADVWHKYHTTAMIYPGYLPIGAPSWQGSEFGAGVRSNHHVTIRRPSHNPICSHKTPSAARTLMANAMTVC